MLFLAGESPAHEVFAYEGEGKGYFARSRVCSKVFIFLYQLLPQQ